uniref:C3H1-type domain-containing protein n=1 Tax=Alexandrium monilatum TaxID=311494 RepID=A0A7S4W423_9DINO
MLGETAEASLHGGGRRLKLVGRISSTLTCSTGVSTSSESPRPSESEDTEESLIAGYPTELCVKNTFLQFSPVSDLLEGRAAPLRRSHSAPAPRGARTEESASAASQAVALTEGAGSAQLQQPPPPPAAPPSAPTPELSLPPPPPAPPGWPLEAEGSSSAPTTRASTPAVLRLADALGQPEPGHPELPTVGSAGHRLGRCKPCAFVWKEAGCGNGTECPFCHLCGPSERRRRKKERKAERKVPLSLATSASSHSPLALPGVLMQQVTTPSRSTQVAGLVSEVPLPTPIGQRVLLVPCIGRL